MVYTIDTMVGVLDNIVPTLLTLQKSKLYFFSGKHDNIKV